MNNQGINTSPSSLHRVFFLLLVLAAFGSASLVRAQTTSFTYQGRLTESGTAANGTYDVQFKLYDGAGNQIGSTITNGAVAVTNGVFTVQLDYGAGAFTGPDRFLELGVRLAGSADPYTVLSPRQPLTASPYAIRAGSTATADTAAKADSAKKADSATTADTATTATNATQLGGVVANQYVLTSDSRLSDPRPPTPGSSSYLQNTLSQQSANFNISGDGLAGGTLSANTVNATTQYNLGGKRALSVAGLRNIFAGELAGAVNTFGSDNSFFGYSAGAANTVGGNSFFGSRAGAANTTGVANSFFGKSAGAVNTTGGGNTFFGFQAGAANTTGDVNSFFGNSAGTLNTTGISNAFFGSSAGYSNTTGSLNSFFGSLAGISNTEGNSNSFFGREAGGVNTLGAANSFFGITAGKENTTGSSNSFFGHLAGAANISGDNNTAIGHLANMASGDLTNAIAIGARARVAQSNSLVLGSINGVNGASADTNVGIGTTTPNAKFHLAANGGNIVMGNPGCSSGFAGIGFGSSLANCTNYSLLGDGTNTMLSRPTGGSIFFREGNATQMSIAPGGVVTINTLGAGGPTQLCRNPSNQISDCSSSLRYKTNIQPFISGLSVLNRLRPITFDWKQGGMHDLGFGAEDIAAVEPLLITRNDKGEVEGVKYDRITAVLVNAIKEQQEQIKQLKKLVCQRHRRATVCK